MTFKGHVKSGQIVLDEPMSLPEGAAVNVEFVQLIEQPSEDLSSVLLRHAGKGQGEIAQSQSNIWDRLREFAGTAEGLPEDLAENHDHYLYGTPKRSTEL